ncbi:MAG: hypothetical protein EA397_12645 [Deltaproteobacteria bacterium]|nr:MAG: hypothetical protein EA397_12645 [Deltaproteobacteria bacterium]
MKTLVPLLLLAISVPAAAQSRGADQITQRLNERGPVGYINTLCDQLNGVPVWGGVRSSQQRNATELQGSGVKVTCGSNGRAESVELSAGFTGPLPENTSLDMNFRQVWRTLKRAKLHKRADRERSKMGSTIRLNRKVPVTWRFADRRGRNGVQTVEINK